MEEFEKLLEKINSIQQMFGVGGAALILLLIFGGYLLWKFIVTSTKKIAEEISVQNLKIFQSELDKGMVKFSSKHQKQIDAVQECYQALQELQSFVIFIAKGDKFVAQLNNKEGIENLTKFRFDFKRKYNKNKILFPKKLNAKVETLFPEIDTFIEDYIGGLMPNMMEEGIQEEQDIGLQIAGIWPMGKLEPTLEKLDEIGKEIESEFRKIYGVEEN
ncbi:MAG: hypothetical protein ABJF04_16200 [Reichenbachiella sp.]|uniref:hypothetical protein n=1 Tax=Reichenbachiella sp. TaxID=2184521 RepID=UPI0032672F3F